MPSEKARKLNTREIHLQDFRLYISENMVYPPSALWALDGRLHVPREWGGGGGGGGRGRRGGGGGGGGGGGCLKSQYLLQEGALTLIKEIFESAYRCVIETLTRVLNTLTQLSNHNHGS